MQSAVRGNLRLPLAHGTPGSQHETGQILVIKHLLAALSFLLLVAACTTLPTQDIQIEVDAHPNADFSKYKSYTWLGSAAIINDTVGKWEPPGFDADAEIRFLIDRELRGRGMSEDSVNPDMTVAFGAGIDMDNLRIELDLDSYITTTTQVPQGALVVILIDRTTGLAIWAGLATADIQEEPGPEVVKKRLEYVITSMFKELPK